jgi:hypothetical protein
MFKIHLWFVLLCIAGSARAEFISLGSHGTLEINAPEDWQIVSKMVGDLGCNVSLTPKNGANAKGMVSIVFPPAPKPIDTVKIDHDLTATCSRFVTGSVEQKITLIPLRLAQGYGVYATFTDAALVGQPAKRGDYKVMSSGLIQFTADVLAVISVFSDDSAGAEQKQLLSTVSGMKVVAAK